MACGSTSLSDIHKEQNRIGAEPPPCTAKQVAAETTYYNHHVVGCQLSNQALNSYSKHGTCFHVVRP
jgi:hypothetical protein